MMPSFLKGGEMRFMEGAIGEPGDGLPFGGRGLSGWPICSEGMADSRKPVWRCSSGLSAGPGEMRQKKESHCKRWLAYRFPAGILKQTSIPGEWPNR